MANLETATLAGGCFWCTEAVFKKLKGVVEVEPGYSGGKMDKPSYEQVSTGKTGHAEVIQIKFDPKIISFEKLLDVFFATHDPTTKDRQGTDVGSQYRSIIFYHNQKQKQLAEEEIKKQQSKFSDPIVTELLAFENFYKAEDYHQNYYEQNKTAPYCQLVIDPKITKLYRDFKEDLKEK